MTHNNQHNETKILISPTQWNKNSKSVQHNETKILISQQFTHVFQTVCQPWVHVPTKAQDREDEGGGGGGGGREYTQGGCLTQPEYTFITPKILTSDETKENFWGRDWSGFANDLHQTTLTDIKSMR